MKKLSIYVMLIVAVTFYIGCDVDDTSGPDVVDVVAPHLVINEFMASNNSAVTDPDEDANDGDPFEDWFELYNADTMAVNIAGMYVTDDLTNTMLFQIPSTNATLTTIQPGGFLVIWCDKEMPQGANHVDFALSAGGESIGIYMSDGVTAVDELTYEAQTSDYSYGSNPDGSETWQVFPVSTPGTSNTGAPTNYPPQIGTITVEPDSITAETAVIVSAVVTDADGNLQTVKVTYGVAGSVNTELAMTASGDTYSAELGVFADHSVIYFFVTAADAEGESVKSDTLSFEVGYVPPALFINEYLASNDTSFTDENGEFDDWIEIFNPGPNAVDIGGMYITDELSNLTAWLIPATAPDTTTIPAGGFLVLYADKQTFQGVLHVEIKLSGNGEQIGLTAPDGLTVIDSLTFEAQETDKSMGRQPDGSDNWIQFNVSTPGASNN